MARCSPGPQSGAQRAAAAAVFRARVVVVLVVEGFRAAVFLGAALDRALTLDRAVAAFLVVGLPSAASASSLWRPLREGARTGSPSCFRHRTRPRPKSTCSPPHSGHGSDSGRFQ